MERQSYLFIAFLCLLSSSAFGQKGVTRIYTDYDGYWTSSQTSINPVKPDNKNNLLGFVWDGVPYSTGVNDALLRSKGVAFSPQLYQAFPVNNIILNGLNANYVALGYKEDGDIVSGRYPYSVPVKISEILNRGINGLDMGSGITNIPASAEPLTFNFGGVIDPNQIGDNVPDLLISQIASPGANNLDKVWFEDVNHNRVGLEISIDMSNNLIVPSVGNWTLDLYSPVTGVMASAKTDRPIRIWAADATIFGLDVTNYTQPLYLRYKLGGSSDPAFLAFNRRFIEIIDANDDAAFTELNTPVNIDVLLNDSPAQIIAPATLKILQAPLHGTATVLLQNGTRVIKYEPALGYEGTDSFTYQVSNDSTTPSSGTAAVTLTIGSADISLLKTFSPSATYFGDEITFNINITNNGTGTAKQVVLNDLIPSGYSYISSANSRAGLFNPATGILTLGTLLAGESNLLQIKAKVNPSGNYTNTASATAISIDHNLLNNTSTVIPVPTSMTDLAVSKTVDIAAPLMGSNVVFTIQARNLGPSEATGVKVVDLLPDGYTLISAVPSTGTYTPANGIWQIGDLPTAAAPVLTITAKVNTTGNYSNTAVIDGAQPDHTPGNNTATVITIPIPLADLAIGKTLDNSTLNNNTAVFKLTVTNNGPNSAPNIRVKDILPAGYSYISSSSQTGTYSVQTGEWNFSSLAVGASAILTINTTLNSTGSYLNTATVNSDARDPQTGNNTDSTSPEPLAPTGTASQSFCENEHPTVANLTAQGTRLKWYTTATGGLPIVNSTPLTNGTSYFASQTIAGTESANRLAIQVILIATPPAPLLVNDIPVSYCLNDPAAPLQAVVNPDNTLLWYTMANGGTAQLIAPTPQTTVAGTIIYYVSQRNAFGCEGPRTAIPVTVNTIPLPPVSGGAQTICETASPIVLTATAGTPAGYSIVWYNSSNQVITQPVLSTTGTITYYAAAINDATGCQSVEKTAVQLTINPAAPKPISGGNQAVCPTFPVQTLTAAATTVAGNIVVWYDAAITGNPVANPSLNNIGTITYYAAAKSLLTGCESLERTAVSLTIYPPADAAVRVDQPTCDHRTGGIYITSTSGISFSLSARGQATLITNTSGEFTALQPGEYRVVVETINGCTLTLPAIQINQPFCPSVTLSKTADNTVTKAAEIITYTLIVTNTGNVALREMKVTDAGADQGSISPASVDILAGQSARISARHTVTQAEVNSGSFSNQAAVKGLAPDNSMVTDPLSDDPGTALENDPTVVRIIPSPAIKLVKAGILTADYETVNYTFSIQNTGNVTLYAVNLKDEKLGIDKVLQTEISPGETLHYNEAHQLTVTDKNNRSITNTAKVTASLANGTTVTDISGTQQNNDLPTVVQIPTEATVALIKTASLTGNQVTYTFRVINTGKLSLSTLTFTDPKVGWNHQPMPGTLLPGSSLSFDAVYQLTQADRELGRVTNTATVNAVTQGGVIVEDRSGTAINDDLPTTIAVPSPPIAINDQAETKANLAVIIDILKNDDAVNSSFDKSAIIITSAPKNGTVSINSDGTVTYSPFPGFTGNDTFSYRVSDIEGYKSNIAEVSINANFFSLIIANTFTPNGDGVNDYFNIVGLNQYADNELTIFTRWGNEVYRKKDYENNWSGEGLGEGTYFYLLKVKRKGSREYEVFKGWILLKRAYIN